MKRITTFAIVTACVLLVVPAHAELLLLDAGVVGAIETDGQNSNPTNELQWAQYLLNLGAGVSTTADGNVPLDTKTENYSTSPTNYNATLTGGTQVQGANTDVSGYKFVLAKYDGKNAGYVLFYVPHYGNTIPSTSYSIWGQNEGQYGLSHFTGFSSTSVSIPDGGMTLMLLGGGLVGLETLRRKLRS